MQEPDTSQLKAVKVAEDMSKLTLQSKAAVHGTPTPSNSEERYNPRRSVWSQPCGMLLISLLAAAAGKGQNSLPMINDALCCSCKHRVVHPVSESDESRSTSLAFSEAEGIELKGLNKLLYGALVSLYNPALEQGIPFTLCRTLTLSGCGTAACTY